MHLVRAEGSFQSLSRAGVYICVYVCKCVYATVQVMFIQCVMYIYMRVSICIHTYVRTCAHNYGIKWLILYVIMSIAENISMQKQCLIADHEWAVIPLSIDMSLNQKDERQSKELIPPPWLINAGKYINT